MFAWWGHFVYRFRWPVLGISVLLLAGSVAVIGFIAAFFVKEVPLKGAGPEKSA